jgi:hypothetical protein
MPLLQHSLSSIHVLFTVGPSKGQCLLLVVQVAIALQVMLLQSMSILFRLDLGDFDECFGGLVLCNQFVRVDGKQVNGHRVVFVIDGSEPEGWIDGTRK